MFSMYGRADGDERDTGCEMEVVNNSNEVVLFCWVDFEGILHHFYPINDGSIRDGSVTNRHVECAHTRHAFLCIRQSPNLPKRIGDVRDSDFRFFYRPFQANGAGHRHTLVLTNLGVSNVSCTALITPSAVIDTSRKEYMSKSICGFTVYYEPGTFEAHPELLETLAFDLDHVQRLLPSNALQLLQTSTRIWVNNTITYGPVSSPIVGRACTYHPADGSDWLHRMGMSVEKRASVEVMCAEDYLRTRHLWGPGGVLLHELSHAYHDKHIVNGFENESIRNAYMKSMGKALYDKVAVHGPQGKDGARVKAYACANCMEFFAELSTAFMWDEDRDTEYNKWFPHNRYQLKEHDVEAYAAIQEAWGLGQPFRSPCN